MSPAELKISRSELKDVADLHSLIQSAYRGESSRAGWTTEADLLDGQRTDPQALQEIISDPNKVLFQARRGSELVGCVCLEKKDNRVAYLGMLTVSPTQQRSGTGKFLLKHCEQWAAETWRTQKIEMTVFTVRKELLDWYGRRGYHKTGEIRAFPMDDVRLGIPKVPHLEFFVLAKALEQIPNPSVQFGLSPASHTVPVAD